MPLHSKSSTTTFRSSYLQEFPWVREHPTFKTIAVCSLCKKDINIGGMGKTALNSHSKSTKHILNEKTAKKCVPLNVFIRRVDDPAVPGPSSRRDEVVNVSDNLVPAAATDNVHHQPNQTPIPTNRSLSTMEKYLLCESVTKSEIFWCLQTVFNHIPFAVAARCANSFKSQFPDSEVASKLKLDYTKIGYMIVFGLAPYFDRQLGRKLNDCSHLVLCFDESLNKVSQRQQMDLHIRWWDPVIDRVETRYLTSVFLGHARSEDLLQGIKNAISPETLNKVVQISMDGPNVNLKLLNELQQEISETNGHVLLNIGSCGLHTLHGAFKNGMQATKWDIVGFLRALYNLFKNSPARRADFIHYTSSDTFPLKFCAVRWVESGHVAQRALAILPSVRKYVDCVVRDKKEPACYSFSIVKEKLSDKFLSPKLAFFVSLCGLFEPILKEFQSDSPMAPFIYDSIKTLVLILLEKCVKKEHLYSTRDRINKINLSSGNLLSVKHFDLGFATTDALKTCKTSSDLEKLALKKEAMEAVLTMAKKILEKSPIKYSFAKSISCLDPSVIKNNGGETYLTRCLEQLVAKNWISGIKADNIKRQYLKLFSIEHVLNQCNNYKRNITRLDDFFIALLNEQGPDEYVDLRNFFKLVLSLSHGNASVERGFSVNKQCLVDNLKEESLVAVRKVYDAVKSAGGVESIEVATEMIHAAKNAHARYTDHLFKKREEMKTIAQAEIERKKAANEKKELEAERLQVLCEARKRAAELEDRIVELSKKCKL